MRLCVPAVGMCTRSHSIEPQHMPSVAAEARCLSPDGTLCRCGSVRLSVGLCVPFLLVCVRARMVEPQPVPVWVFLCPDCLCTMVEAEAQKKNRPQFAACSCGAVLFRPVCGWYVLHNILHIHVFVCRYRLFV